MPDLQLNDNLALQSLLVAQQIDRRSSDEFQPKILSDFGERLSRASGVSDNPHRAYLITDPVATEVFSEAIQESSEQPISDMAALVDETRKIVQSLIAGGHGLSSKEFEEMKAFCLALHKSMMARRLPPMSERESSFDYDLRFAG
jgi:hypothetical protein